MDTIIQIQALGQKMMPNPEQYPVREQKWGRLRLKNLSRIIFFNNLKLKLNKWGIH